MLKYYGYDIKGKRVTVVGTSLVIGKPLAVMLVNSSGTVTMCHVDTVNTEEHCRNAEILVSATGVAGLINENYISSGQIVLDVGINKNKSGELCGDVDFVAVEPIVEAISPVPGGVGTVTSTVLVKHVIEAAEREIFMK